MKSFLHVGLLCLVVLSGQNVFAQTQEDKFIKAMIRSEILNEDRPFAVHLPRNYELDAQKKYPVMYVLDGVSQSQHAADKMQVLADAGIAPAAIVIGIQNTKGNRERDQTPPFMKTAVEDENSPLGAGDKFLKFLETELMPLVDKTYRTSGYKALTGNSRGGLFVLYTLVERPDLFQARFLYSTPVWRYDGLMVKKVSEFLTSRNRPSGFLFLSVGEKETDRMKSGFDNLSNVLKKSGPKKLKWIADRTPHAVHEDNSLISMSKGFAEWGKYLSTAK